MKPIWVGLQIVLLAGSFGPTSSHAANFVASKISDDGAGSLREAIKKANISPGADSITFQGLNGKEIALGDELEIHDTVLIAAPVGETVVLRGEDRNDDVLQIVARGILVEIQNLVIAGGDDGIELNEASFQVELRISGCLIKEQAGDDGVSIDGEGNRVHIEGTTIEGAEDGLAVEGNLNAVTLIQSTIARNGEDGVEVDGHSNVLTISDTAVVSNGTDPNDPNDGIDFNGANNVGIFHQVTLSKNSEDGLDVEGAGNQVTLNHSSVTANQRDGLFLQDASGQSSLTIAHTIVAANGRRVAQELLGIDVRGPLTSGGFNFIGRMDAPPFYGMRGDQFGRADEPLDAKLGELDFNGGKTLNHAPLPGSSVIDAGDPAFRAPNSGTQKDQRVLDNFPRVTNGRVDIGAIEHKP